MELNFVYDTPFTEESYDVMYDAYGAGFDLNAFVHAGEINVLVSYFIWKNKLGFDGFNKRVFDNCEDLLHNLRAKEEDLERAQYQRNSFQEELIAESITHDEWLSEEYAKMISETETYIREQLGDK